MVARLLIFAGAFTLAASDCCAAGTSACSGAVNECVCSFDPYCCHTEWDNQCVLEAINGCDLLCATPGCDSIVLNKVTAKPYVGGRLYVTKAASPTEWTEVHDLADAAIASSCIPKHKPHMVIPSPNGKYAAIPYTGDTFVHILDSATKAIVMCIDVTTPKGSVVGGAMHTAAWYGDSTILICDMTGSVDGIGGGAIHKFDLNFEAGTYSYVLSTPIGSTADARGTTNTKPIALANNPMGAYASHFFVTDAVGGASIINAENMEVVKNLPVQNLLPCSGGGLWVEPHPEDPKIVIAQYGQQQGNDCLFKVDMELLAITKAYDLPSSADDAHGIQFCKNTAGEFFLINTNRASFTLDILNYATGETVVAGFDLNRALPDYTVPRLQPDVIYLAGETLFMAARGPRPVSAVKPQNYLPTATPGAFFLKLTDCVNPTYGDHYALLTELGTTSGLLSDVHGLWGVGDEIWVVDQAATGSTAVYEAFSHCPAPESE